jgi:hypothetical protein
LEFLKVLKEIFNKGLIDSNFDVESLEEIVNVESSSVRWVWSGLVCEFSEVRSLSFKKYLEDIFLLTEHLFKKSSVIYLSIEKRESVEVNALILREGTIETWELSSVSIEKCNS